MYVIIHVCIIHMYVTVVEQFVVTPDTYIYYIWITLDLYISLGIWVSHPKFREKELPRFVFKFKSPAVMLS